MSFNLYPEDESRLRARIRQIVLEHIQAMGGSYAGGRKKRKTHKKRAGVLAGGMESHREHRIGAKKNAFIKFMKKNGMNAEEAAKHYKKMKKHRKKGMGYDLGGRKRKHHKKRGMAMAGAAMSGGTKKQKKVAAKNPWLKFVKKHRKQGMSLKQISKLYHQAGH